MVSIPASSAQIFLSFWLTSRMGTLGARTYLHSVLLWAYVLFERRIVNLHSVHERDSPPACTLLISRTRKKSHLHFAEPNQAGASSGTFFLTTKPFRSLMSERKRLISSCPNGILSVPGNPAEEGKEKDFLLPALLISSHCFFFPFFFFSFLLKWNSAHPQAKNSQH